MKKTILTILTILSSFLVNAQSKSKTLNETSIGPITYITYKECTELSTNQTYNLLSLLFVDGRYQYLTSVESIYFIIVNNDTTTTSQFINDLNSMIGNIGSGSTMYLDRGDYRMLNSDTLPKTIYLYNKGGAFTRINKNQALKLIEWIKSLSLYGN